MTSAVRLCLKPLKPPIAAAAILRRFSADTHPTPPSPPPPEAEDPISGTLALLQASDPNSWPANPELANLLSAVSAQSVLQITRRLPDSKDSLQFFYYLNANTHQSDSASSAFQAVLEHAMRENPKAPEKLYELFTMARDQNTTLSVNSGTLLIRCFSRAKMLDEMVAVFDSMDAQVKNSHVMNVYVAGMFGAGRVDDALKLVDEMLQPDACFPPNKNTFTIVFSSILARNCRGRRLTDEEIYNLFLLFVKPGRYLDGFWLREMISRFCKNGECDKAWNVLHEWMSCGSDVEAVSCNTVLSELGRRRDYDRMNLLMKEMKEKGIQPSVVTYGIMVKSLCSLRRLDEAMEVLEKMRDGEAGIEPDVVIYNSLIDGLCKVGRHEEALELFERMRLSESKCKPNTITYNSMIDGLFKAGEIDKGSELFEDMSNRGVEMTIVTLNTMVRGMCKHGRVSSAMDLFKSLVEKKGLKGNVVTYTVLITAFCGSNNIERAMKLFEEMKGNGCIPDAIVYYSLISGYTKAGRMDDATSIMWEMKEAGFSLDIVGYNIMIGGFCRTNKMDKTAELLKEMEKSGLNPDRVTYNTLLSYYCDRGDFKHAHKVMKKMVADGLTPTEVTYGALIQGYCSKGSLDAAMRIFQDMKSTSKVTPNTVIYNILINSHCKDDDVDTALELMEEMKNRGVKPNTTTYNAMFKGLAHRNWCEKALKLMDEMTEQKCMPDYVTIEILTEWLPAVGEMEKFKEFVDTFCDEDKSRDLPRIVSKASFLGGDGE